MIPREPSVRLRLLSLWFALFAISIQSLELIVGGSARTSFRLAGLAAVLSLAGWLLWGHRRRRFPEFSTAAEAILLIVVTASTTLPLRAMGLFLAMVQFRSLYVTRREFWVLPVSYGIARVVGMALTVQPAPYGALSLTVLLQVVGMTFISGILFLLMVSVERQAATEAVLRESQKMEAVGQLAGGVAHDFNNLLTVIEGHVFMLEQSGTVTADAAKHLEGITGATSRAGSLTRQLLAFGRRQLLRPETLDLNDVVRHATKLISPVVGERIRVVTDLAPDLPPVNADAGQLEQVLLNLALNARDAMPAGGALHIATSAAEGPAGRQIRLTFQDSGAGMEPQTIAHIFEPFFTTKRAGKGTGLGLATAYGIIRQSAGDITVESTPGQGSTFIITLPAASGIAPRPAPAGAPARVALPMSVRRVLLVEDNDGVRDFAREALTRAGVTVFAARDGNEGLKVAREEGYALDVIVTDVVMPELNGPQMVERLREARPDLKVLYLTGYAADAVAGSELRPGRDALLEKPFSARALREAINALAPPPGIPGTEGRQMESAPPTQAVREG